jgi:hypothetical protein
MKFPTKLMTIVGLLLASTLTTAEEYQFPRPALDYAPEQYICYRATGAIQIDGNLDESDWQRIGSTALFVDIEGELRPAPRFDTRAWMLWDNEYFYFAAELEEPDVWAKLDYRDAIIFYDNDFEIFIDPDGDSHHYYELEVNAFSTEWDLFLVKPYRDGGPALHSWDIQGLQTAVAIEGTLNQPGDVDKGWTVEIAIPWEVLKECAHRDTPPRDGDRWRVNFSRVEWQTEVIDGVYHKVNDPATGKPLPEANWVWSPQGLINMHYPEMWGVVQFSGLTAGAGVASLHPRVEEQVAWSLRQVYYAQRTWQGQHQLYADWSQLSEGLEPPPAVWQWPPLIERTTTQFSATVTHKTSGATMVIDHEGRVVITASDK